MVKEFQFASKDLTAGQLNGLVKKVGGHANAKLILQEELEIKLEVPKKLKLIGEVELPRIEKFYPGKSFVSGEGLNFVFGDDESFLNFLETFRSRDGKTECREETPGANLQVYEVSWNKRVLSSHEVVEELGVNETTGSRILCAGHLYALIRQQATGESGILSTNEGNCIYAKDGRHDDLWEIRTWWVHRGWCLGARLIEYPVHGLYKGMRIFVLK